MFKQSHPAGRGFILLHLFSKYRHYRLIHSAGSSVYQLYGPLTLDFWMLSSMSVMLSEDQKSSVEEASSPPRETFRSAVKRRWNYFHKPLLSILIGALVFGTGTAMSLLYFTQVGNVPYLVGPLFLSMGLMFLVTGLVWIPIIKQKMVHTAMSQMGHDRPLLTQRGSCATIS